MEQAMLAPLDHSGSMKNRGSGRGRAKRTPPGKGQSGRAFRGVNRIPIMTFFHNPYVKQINNLMQ